MESESFLINKRESARTNKNFKLSDEIRNELEKRNTFVFDTANGQEVYFELGGTREDLINKINRNKRAEKLFDAWLFSMNSKK